MCKFSEDESIMVLASQDADGHKVADASPASEIVVDPSQDEDLESFLPEAEVHPQSSNHCNRREDST